MEAFFSGRCKQAVVDVVELDGQKKLVAYLVPETGSSLNLEERRNTLGKFLPSHMLPSHFLVLECLPLNANGKVDRSLLPPPSESVPAEVIAPPEDGIGGAIVLGGKLFYGMSGMAGEFGHVTIEHAGGDARIVTVRDVDPGVRHGY